MMSISTLLILAAGFLCAVIVGAMVVVAVQNRRMGGPQPPAEPPRPPAPLTGDVAGDTRELLARGRKIEAIKRVRELTGLGLKEAKDYVDALEAGRGPAAPSVLPARPAAPPADPAALDAEARELIARGNPIAAIKLVRERTNMGLKEAKDYVDSLAKRS